MSKTWWGKLDFSRLASVRHSIDQSAFVSLASMALDSNNCVYEYTKSGNLITAPGELMNKLYELGGKVMSKSISEYGRDDGSGTDEGCSIVWDNAMLSISIDINEDSWTHLSVKSLDETLAFKIKVIADEHIKKTTQGKAYIFSAGEMGPELKQIPGKAGVALIRDNYSTKVLADFDHIVSDLQSKDPCAKLVIVDGDPGMGKTYLVRGLTTEVENAMFVLVQPSMIQDIMSPQFVPVLMENRDKTQAIVFIVEDADSCLVKREGDNMNSISSLLNLGAGLFGDLFDVRVIATTNSRRIEMDPAIVRNGRCCRHIEMELLGKTQADAVLTRITDGKLKEMEGNQGSRYTLADIYFAARNQGLVEKKKDGRVGFFA